MKSSRIGFVIFGVAAAVVAAVGALIFFHDRPRPVSSPAAPQAVRSPPASSPTLLSHGRFETLRVYSPAATPTSFVLLLSGDAGWNGASVDLAHVLVGAGALVVGVDLAKLEANLDADGGDCVFPDGDLENLSHFVQAYYRLPAYLSPILAGDGEGAAFAYAMLAQAPANTFAGALSLNFRPSLAMRKPLCRGSGVEFHKRARGRGVELLPSARVHGRWIVVQGAGIQAGRRTAVRDFVAQVSGAEISETADTVPQSPAPRSRRPDTASLLASFAKLRASALEATPPSPAALGNLPLTEIPAPGGGSSDAFAIMLSGDGGWAGLDKDVAAALVAAGIPVVGLDSLRYFWGARTPQGLADDLDRMIRFYLARFGKKRVFLVGYSQGADVLPFAVNRLPAGSRTAVALVATIGLSEHALFEFHLSSWISDDDSGPPTRPEIARIAHIPVLCIYGKDEDDSACPKLDPAKIHVVPMPGGHHFNGDYTGLARRILEQARR